MCVAKAKETETWDVVDACVSTWNDGNGRIDGGEE